MFQYVHQLLFNFACLLFGVGWVVNSKFFRVSFAANSCLLAENKTNKSGVCGAFKTMSKNLIKDSVELRGW